MVNDKAAKPALFGAGAVDQGSPTEYLTHIHFPLTLHPAANKDYL